MHAFLNEIRAERARNRRDDSLPHTATETHTQPSVDPSVVAQSARVAGQVFVGSDEQRLISFRKHKPPAFQGLRDPKVVTTWLMGMKKIFQVMGDVREAKQGEFEKLVQGTMAVDAYVAKFNELVKFANYEGVLPTPEFLSAKFQRGLNEKIAKRMSNTAVRNFADLVTQCKRVKSVYNRYPKSGSLRTSGPPGNSNKGGYHQNNNRGRGLQVRQSPGQFKRGGGQRSGFNGRNSNPRCDKCKRFHQGPCTAAPNSCFKCGKVGHYANNCYSNTGQ
ncbi:uncharacterized protein LOC133315830, partial [Gastrolobium bilobum]|uniref:uncharacterized protein LOC133315830 n=1 Tax=Gastrolobium bilobum TaxID=150636 RepID=UPI002AB2466A